MKVAIYTLGCKVNQYETQAMERELRARGHETVPFGQEADAYVINTCSVTAAGDQKSRQAVHRARREHPGAVVAVCGCWSQTHAAEARALGADVLTGTGERMGFLSLLERAVREHGPERGAPLEAVDPPFERRHFEWLPAGGLEGRTRALLKVEDGCANFCSYCIIPYARGPVRSLPMGEAAVQALELKNRGYQEIVLTGIEISSWGRDLCQGTGLIDLLEAVSAAVPGVRLRLGSLEPRTITEEFCQRAAILPDLCPQFHLSLQSGCDATLRRRSFRKPWSLFKAAALPGCTFSPTPSAPAPRRRRWSRSPRPSGRSGPTGRRRPPPPCAGPIWRNAWGGRRRCSSSSPPGRRASSWATLPTTRRCW